jgi:hypothetical protein
MSIVDAKYPPAVDLSRIRYETETHYVCVGTDSITGISKKKLAAEGGIVVGKAILGVPD